MYSKTSDTTYMVYWPRHRIAKAGYSAYQRWRSFELRGAKLIGLVEWPVPYGFRGALALETKIDHELHLRFPLAFRSRLEATQLLGCQGGGYLECYRVPRTINDPEHYLAELLVSTASVPDTSMSTDERTDLRRTTHLSSYLTLGNARGGAARFESDVDPFGCDLCGCVLNCDGSCGPECDHQEQAPCLN